MFSKSKVQRFWEDKGKNPSLGPGAYDVDKAAEALKSKAYQNLTISGTARFLNDEDAENLGPGAYNVELDAEAGAQSVRKPRPPSFRRQSLAPERAVEFNVPQAAESETERLRKRLRTLLAEKDNLTRHLKHSSSRLRQLEAELAENSKLASQVPSLQQQLRKTSRRGIAASAAAAAALRNLEREEKSKDIAERRAYDLELVRICKAIELSRLRQQHNLLQKAALNQRDAAVEGEWDMSEQVVEAIECSCALQHPVEEDKSMWASAETDNDYIASLQEEIELLTTENEGLIIENRTCADEILRVQSSLDASQSAYDQKRKQAHDLRAKLQASERTVKEQTESTRALLEQMRLITDACQRNVKEKVALLGASRKTSQALEQAEAMAISLREQFRKREAELVDALETSEFSMSDALADAQGQISCLEEDISHCREAMEVLCTEKAETEHALDALRAQLGTAEEQIRHLEIRQADLEDSLLREQDAKINAEKEVGALEQTCIELKDEIREEQERRHQAATVFEEKIDTLSSELQNSQHSLHVTKGKLDAALSDLDAARSNFESTQKQLDDANNQFASKEADMMQQEKALEFWREDANTKAEALSEAENRSVALKSRIGELESQVQQRLEQEQELREQFEQKHKDLQERLQSSEQLQADLNARISQLTTEKTNHAQNAEEWEFKALSSQQKLDELSSSSTAQIYELNNALHGARDELSNLRTRFGALETELESKNIELCQITNERDTLQGHFSRLSSSFELSPDVDHKDADQIVASLCELYSAQANRQAETQSQLQSALSELELAKRVQEESQSKFEDLDMQRLANENSLKASMEEQHVRESKLVEACAKLEAKITELSEQIALHEETIATSKSLSLQLENDLSQERGEFTTLLQQHNELKSRQDSLEVTIQTLEGDKRAMQDELVSVRKSHNDVSVAFQAEQEANITTQIELQKKTLDLTELTLRFNQLKSELEASSALCQDLRNKLTDLQTAKSSLAQELQIEREAHQKTNSNLSDSASALTSLSQTHLELNAELTACKERETSLREQLSALEKTQESITNDLCVEKNCRLQITQHLESKSSAFDQLEHAHAELKRELEAAMHEVLSTNHELDALKTEHGKMVEILRVEKAAREDAEGTLHAKLQVIEHLETQMENLEHEAARVDHEHVQRLKQMVHDLHDQLDAAVAKESSLETQVHVYRIKLAESNLLAEDLDSRSNELALTKAEQERAREELSRLATENAALTGHQNHRQKIQHLKQVKFELSELRVQNSKLQALMKRKDKRIESLNQTMRQALGNLGAVPGESDQWSRLAQPVNRRRRPTIETRETNSETSSLSPPSKSRSSWSTASCTSNASSSQRPMPQHENQALDRLEQDLEVPHISSTVSGSP